MKLLKVLGSKIKDFASFEAPTCPIPFLLYNTNLRKRKFNKLIIKKVSNETVINK